MNKYEMQTIVYRRRRRRHVIKLLKLVFYEPMVRYCCYYYVTTIFILFICFVLTWCPTHTGTHKCQIHKDISIRRWPNNKTRSHKTIPIVVVVQRTAHGNNDERHMLVAATQSVQLKFTSMAFYGLHL